MAAITILAQLPPCRLMARKHRRTVSSRANMLSFLSLIAYNRRCSPNSYDSAIDGAVSEVFGAESAGEQFLQLLRTSYQHAIANAHNRGSCRGDSEGG